MSNPKQIEHYKLYYFDARGIIFQSILNYQKV